MKSTLIKDTTKSERIALIKQWQEPEDGLEDNGMDLFDLYADYINGTKEIAECNAAFQTGFVKELEIRDRFEFREIRPGEAEEAAEIEQLCFPPNEACAPVRMEERVLAVPELFLVAVDKETRKIAGFLNGLATDETIFRDEFFENAGLHKADGENVMLLGLDVLPEYRRQGLATEIVNQYVYRQRKEGRKQLILTCLEDKIKMYEKMGFQNKGISQSSWGGEQWYEMCLCLTEKES